MLGRAVPWLFLLAAYAAAHLTLDATAMPVQAPRLLDALEGDSRQLFLAACATLAFAVAASLARCWVPDPWATRAVLVAGLAPAGFALSGSEAAPPAALLAAGLLLALRARDHPTRMRSLGGAACLAVVPWFGVAYGLAAGLALVALAYWTYRRGRRLYAFLALEFGAASIVTLAGVEVSESVGPAPGAAGVLEVLAGAPLVALAAVSVVIVARRRRDGLARAIPSWHDAEVGVGLTAIALAAVVAAALIEPVGPEAGVPLAAALASLTLRAFRRLGTVFVIVTLGLTVWGAVALAAGERSGWL